MKKITKTIQVNVFESSDGKEFESQEKCLFHEDIINGIKKICLPCYGSGRVLYDNDPTGDGGWGGTRCGISSSVIDCSNCKGKGYLELKTVWQ